MKEENENNNNNNDNDFLEDEYDEDITQEEAWTVVSSFFVKHGLVSQQIGSFNQFLETNIQEIVYENQEIVITPEKKYAPNEKSESEFKYVLMFGQLHISHLPYFKEKDDQYNNIFPSLTCSWTSRVFQRFGMKIKKWRLLRKTILFTLRRTLSERYQLWCAPSSAR